jgi:hypothetical protein
VNVLVKEEGMKLYKVRIVDNKYSSTKGGGVIEETRK